MRTKGPSVPSVQPQALTTLPPAPPLPARVGFTEELAGRRALYAARDAMLGPRGHSYQCLWSVSRLDGRGKVSTLSGTETLYLAPSNKLAVAFEYGEAGRKTLRRALCDGTNFLGVRFDERGKQTTRECVRFSLEQVGRLDRAVAYARLDGLGQTRGVSLALERDFPLLSRVWRTSDGSVLEVDSLIPRPGRPVRLRRYRFDPTLKTLQRVEEWETANGRTTYRSEEYRPAPKSGDPFSQNLPDGYQEKPVQLPPRLVEPMPPADADPRALAALAQWARAHERFYTLHATARVTTLSQKRTPESSDRFGGGRGYDGIYDLWLWRPGRAKVLVEGRGQLPVSQTLKADGQNLTMKEEGAAVRTVPLREQEKIERTLQQYARRNSLDPLQWLFDGPPRLSDYQQIRLNGSVLELSRKDERPQQFDRTYTTETFVRVWLGPEGLPRGFETTQKSTTSGLFERDQPPITILTVQLSELTVDREPPF